MAKYPLRFELPKAKPMAKAPKAAKPAQNRPAPPVTQATLNRAARVQGEEARESVLARRPAAKNVISVVTRMRETPPKKGK